MTDNHKVVSNVVSNVDKKVLLERLDGFIRKYQMMQDEAERLHNWGNMAYFEGQKSAIMYLKRHIEEGWL